MNSVTVTFESDPDTLGRRKFTARWFDTYRPGHPDGSPGERAQVFFAEPEEILQRWRRDGIKVAVA